jgi:hypothetical protein
MFTIKPLARKSNPQFTVRTLGPKPFVQKLRALFIESECRNGKTYAEAIRAWDSKARQNV